MPTQAARYKILALSFEKMARLNRDIRYSIQAIDFGHSTENSENSREVDREKKWPIGLCSSHFSREFAKDRSTINQ
jgi:hypothetical protein